MFSQVRGAPAIGIVGCLSLAVELRGTDFSAPQDLVDFTVDKLKYLVTARPTAVNMADAERTFTRLGKGLLATPGLCVKDIKTKYLQIVLNQKFEDFHGFCIDWFIYISFIGGMIN